MPMKARFCMVELETLLSQPPSADLFMRLTAALERLWGEDLDEAIDHVAAALERWPDEARPAPRATWQRIQAGEQFPPWWRLVRHLRVEEGDTLEVGRALEQLTSVDASNVWVDPSPLGIAHGLRRLDLTGNPFAADLRFPAGTPWLERLSLASLGDLLECSEVGALQNLRWLDLSFNPTLEEIAGLASLPRLEWLDLSRDSSIEDLELLGALRALETLIIDGCTQVTDLGFLSRLPRLSVLSASGLDGLPDIEPLGSTSIEQLAIGGAWIADGHPIGRMTSLDDLTVLGVPRLRDLSFLAALTRLLRLALKGCRAPLPRLEMPGIDRLLIEACPGVRDLTSIARLTSTRTLLLSHLPIRDIGPLARFLRLESLALRHCPRISDLTPLAQLPLELVDLTGCDPGLDTSPLPPGCRVVR